MAHSEYPCPSCGVVGPCRVIDVRTIEDGRRRRRECQSCKRRFTTYEISRSPMSAYARRKIERERWKGL
ncbi:MAG: hypothetical protein AMS18_00215 [Gemmatimonas sp. SG8_17]|nr:MAG: hypothetical protein AMS18_00215 [Gemmatimonas sp. SG8_17]